MKEKTGDTTPSDIVSLFLFPYLEFSLKYGSKDKSLLDCACGNIYQKIILEDRFKSVLFVDKDIPKVLPDNFITLDLESENLPFENSFFDVVFSFETIEHLLEDRQIHFVNELLRVGKIVIIGSISIDGPNKIGNSIIFKKATETNPHHKKEFSSKEWFSFFNDNFQEYILEFYHSALGEVLEIRQGLNSENGFCNYVVFNKPIKNWEIDIL